MGEVGCLAQSFDNKLVVDLFGVEWKCMRRVSTYSAGSVWRSCCFLLVSPSRPSPYSIPCRCSCRLTSPPSFRLIRGHVRWRNSCGLCRRIVSALKIHCILEYFLNIFPDSWVSCFITRIIPHRTDIQSASDYFENLTRAISVKIVVI